MLLPDGPLPLSLNIVLGTDLIFNNSEGLMIDQKDEGSLSGFKRELEKSGLKIQYENSFVAIPTYCSDVAYIVSRKPKGPQA